MTQIPEDELNQILRAAGIEYPLGLRGVRDLVNQRDGQRERAEEAEELASRTHEAMMAKYAEAGELRERADEAERRTTRAAEIYAERNRGLRARAEEAERRLANVREMVRRLRVAAGGGVTPGYVLARIESVLNGEVPAK